MPYVAYLAAEELHGSGVLSVVVAGLVLGHKSPEIQSAGSRVTERTLWRTVSSSSRTSVFLLIGLQLRILLEKARASGVDNVTILMLCLGVTAWVIVVRVLWMFPAVYLPRLVPAIRRNEPRPPWQNVVVLSWAGMRGVVTLAAAFALDGAVPRLRGAGRGRVQRRRRTLLLRVHAPRLVRLLKVPGPDPAQDALQQALVLQQAVDAGPRRLEEGADGTPRRTSSRTCGPGANGSPTRSGNGWARATAGPRRRPGRSAGSGSRCCGPSAARSSTCTAREGARRGPRGRDGAPRPGRGDARGLRRGRGHRAGRPAQAARPRGVRAPADRAAGAVPGNPGGCEDCLAIGAHDWVSLRMCLHCGHVGCCDSSPRRHATGHFDDVGHPVMRSIELGEGWRWCFVDKVAG